MKNYFIGTAAIAYCAVVGWFFYLGYCFWQLALAMNGGHIPVQQDANPFQGILGG